MDSIIFGRCPLFQCDAKLNVANCSLLKLMEFAKNREEFGADLRRSFQYLGRCDLRSLIDHYVEQYGRLEVASDVALFEFIKLTGVGDGSTLPTQQTILAVFSFVKRSLAELRAASMPTREASERGHERRYEQHRRSITDALHYLKHLLYDLNVKKATICSSYQDFPRNQNEAYLLALTIVTELRNCCLAAGRLIQFVDVFSGYNHFCNDRERSSAFYNYYHAVLAVWVTFVEVSFGLQAASVRYSFGDVRLVKEISSDVNLSLYNQGIRILLYDILVLSLDRWTNITSTNELLFRSPFACGCLAEVVVVLNHLMAADLELDEQTEDLSQFQTSGQSVKFTLKAVNRFYALLFEMIKLFNHDEEGSYQEGKEDFNLNHFQSIALKRHRVVKKDARGRLFPVWIFANLVPLLTLELTIDGLVEDGRIFNVTIPAQLTKLYREIMKECDDTSTITTLLIFTLKFADFLTSTCFDLVSTFLDFFLRRLNTNFSGRSTSVEATFSWLPKNSERWLASVAELVEPSRIDSGLGQFRLFLALLAGQLKTLFEGHQEARTVSITFQRLMSKIIVTLQPRLLRSLDTLGVYNLACFYLVVVRACSLEKWAEMAEKTLNVFAEVHKSESSLIAKQSTELWLMFLFACLATKPTATSVNQKIACQIGKIVSKLIVLSDQSNRATCVEIFKLTLKELKMLLLSDERRFFVYLDSILPIDLVYVYGSLLSPAVRFSSERRAASELWNELLQRAVKLAHEDKDYFGAARFIDRQIVPLVRQEAASDEEHFALLAFNVTLLEAIESGPKSSTLSLTNLVVNLLATTEKLATFQLNYLSLLFEDYLLLSKLRASQSTLEAKLVTTWLRLLIFTPGSGEKLDLVSVNLFENFLVGHHLDAHGLRAVDAPRPMAIDYYKFYLRRLVDDFERATSAQEKAKQREALGKLWTPLVEQAQTIIRVGGNFALVSRIFSTFATLLNICHRLLYSVGKADCLLALVVERILIPSPGSGSGDALVNDQAPALFDRCFPLIFDAFIKLIEGCSDSYIERKIRQLIVFYLPYMVRFGCFEEIKLKLSEQGLYQAWCVNLYQVLDKVYLLQKDPPLARTTAAYLIEFCRRSELSEERAKYLTRQIFAKVNLMAMDFKAVGSGGGREALLQTITNRSAREADGDTEKAKDFIETIIRSFLRANIQQRPARVLETIRHLLPADIHRTSRPILFHELCNEISSMLDDIERRSLVGNHVVLRKLFTDFIGTYERSS